MQSVPPVKRIRTSIRSLFNPRSVNKALTRGVCRSYWTETGPMNEIADCIEHNVDEVREDIVKMVAGIPVEADLDGYSAAELRLDTRDEILSAMVVYGFLSYYDGYLTIPNHELMEKYQCVLARDSMGEVKARYPFGTENGRDLSGSGFADQGKELYAADRGLFGYVAGGNQLW